MRYIAALAILGTLCAPWHGQALAQRSDDGRPLALRAENVIPHGTANHPRCDEGSVEVAAASPQEASLVCLASSAALQMLGRCKITPQKPLRIEIMSKLLHPRGDVIFGLFDTTHQKVLVTRLTSIASLSMGTPYSAISQYDFYKSMVVHEVVHAVMAQNYRRQPASLAAVEYPAYALQIKSLSADTRDKFLLSVAVEPGDFFFNDITLAIDPFAFAGHAYKHLRDSADRCGRLTALLEGEVNFIPTILEMSP